MGFPIHLYKKKYTWAIQTWARDAQYGKSLDDLHVHIEFNRLVKEAVKATIVESYVVNYSL